jgi:hypothetical protein
VPKVIEGLTTGVRATRVEFAHQIEGGRPRRNLLRYFIYFSDKYSEKFRIWLTRQKEISITYAYAFDGEIVRFMTQACERRGFDLHRRMRRTLSNDRGSAATAWPARAGKMSDLSIRGPEAGQNVA